MNAMTMEQVNARWDELQKEEEALRTRRMELHQQEQCRREAEAGDPQVGDLVIFREDFGQAKKGAVAKVTWRGTSSDRFDRPYESLTVDFLFASMHPPLSVLMRVNDPKAVEMFDTLKTIYYDLNRLINDVTGIYPRLWE